MRLSNVTPVNNCNTRLCQMMSEARNGRKPWDEITAKQISMLRDHLRFN